MPTAGGRGTARAPSRLAAARRRRRAHAAYRRLKSAAPTIRSSTRRCPIGSAERAPRRAGGFARVAGWVALGIVLGSVAGWGATRARSPWQARPARAWLPRAGGSAVYSPEVPSSRGQRRPESTWYLALQEAGPQLRAPKLDRWATAWWAPGFYPASGSVALYQNTQGTRITPPVRSDMSATARLLSLRARRQRRCFLWVDRSVTQSSADSSGRSPSPAAYQQLNPPSRPAGACPAACTAL
jgi:hypothetical protein